MKLSDFNYELPKELIAQYPASPRDSSRLLVLERKSGKIIHTGFRNIASYINSSDLLVLNNTKVIKARLTGKRRTGGRAELLLLGELGGGRFSALIKPSGRTKEGDEIIFPASDLKARVIRKQKGGSIVEFSRPSRGLYKELGRLGALPLPPYIKREAEALDDTRYQTVYARVAGAAAAPTAGLHFTEEALRGIESKGADTAHVTLHVSYGTFAPVRTERIEDHKMHYESFRLSKEAAEKINGRRMRGGRIFAVGTTSCRVMESCAAENVRGYAVKAGEGRTNLFIYPSYRFKMTDALLTNFHFPLSTLLMLVSAFAGKELIFKAYREAIERRYRFFSYGDCMLIL